MAHRGHRPNSSEWKYLRIKILNRDGNKCVRCGSNNNLRIHHIKPVDLEGSNELDNLETLCSTCHKSEHHTLWPRIRISKQVKPRKAFRISLEDDLMNWINRELKNRRFSSVSHACAYALEKLRREEAA